MCQASTGNKGFSHLPVIADASRQALLPGEFRYQNSCLVSCIFLDKTIILVQ